MHIDCQKCPRMERGENQSGRLRRKGPLKARCKGEGSGDRDLVVSQRHLVGPPWDPGSWTRGALGLIQRVSSDVLMSETEIFSYLYWNGRGTGIFIKNIICRCGRIGSLDRPIAATQPAYCPHCPPTWFCCLPLLLFHHHHGAIGKGCQTCCLSRWWWRLQTEDGGGVNRTR